jgi:hypothetical protein
MLAKERIECITAWKHTVADAAHVVVERYADRPEYLRFLLSSNATATFTDAAKQAPTITAVNTVRLNSDGDRFKV